MKLSERRVRVEAVSAAFAGLLGILTTFWPNWIETLIGRDPEHRNSSFEWIIVVGLLLISADMGALARHDHRKLLITATQE